MTHIMPEHHAFVNAAGRALRRHCRITAGDRILVGVSGGADSIALLRALAAIAPKRKWELSLVVGHVHHHLRDADGSAQADAQFVEALAGQLNLPFERGDLYDLAAQPGNLEAVARRERYAALQRMAAKHDASIIAVAHQADDQLETILMRLIRGASVKGLCGMAWQRPLPEAMRLIRPLLNQSRSAVLAFLQDINQRWCEDETNTDTTRTRARLRHDVLPILYELQPQLAARTMKLSEHLHGLSAFLDNNARQVCDELVERDVEDAFVFSRADLRQQPTALLAAVLRIALHDYLLIPADQLSEAALSPLQRAITDKQGGKRLFRIHRCQIEVTREKVLFNPHTQ